MANQVRLRGGNSFTKTIRMDAESVQLDPKDPIGAACLGKIVRDTNAGNFDNMGNIGVVAGTFSAIETSNGPVKLGSEEITVLEDPSNNNARHELTNAAMVTNYLSAGMVIVETKVVDVMSP
tara:strand:- start:424 stop:789 length:366 start_codon:yes stop_codon:yes gene_type:complete